MSKNISFLWPSLIIGIGFCLVACSTNAYRPSQELVFTAPDSLSWGHPGMIDPQGTCLFTFKDKWLNEYVLFLKPQYTKVKFDYELIPEDADADTTTLFLVYKGEKYNEVISKYIPVSIGDTIKITLKISDEYPKYDTYYYGVDGGKGFTVKERLGIIYTSDDVINIRGRLFLKKKSIKE